MTDSDEHVLFVRLTGSLLEMLERVAQDSGCSVDNVVHDAITAYVIPPMALDLEQLGQAVLDDLQAPPQYSALSVHITEAMAASMKAFLLPEDEARSLLGDELIEKLTGVTVNTPQTPEMNMRLQAVAVVCRLLRGTLSDVGIRRWWSRPRYLLNGRTPVDLLGPVWTTDTLAFRMVAEMAEADAGFTAT